MRLPIGELSELADAADTGHDDGEDTGAAFVADETEFNIYNTDRKLAAIEEASKKLSALPEKKALIYFAGGVSKDGRGQPGATGSLHQRGRQSQRGDLSHRCAGTDGGPSRRRRQQSGLARHRHLHRLGLQLAARQPSTIRRRRWLPWRRTPAERHSSTATSFRWESCRRSRNSAAITFWATTQRITAVDGKYRKITVKLNNRPVGQAGIPPGILRRQGVGQVQRPG